MAAKFWIRVGHRGAPKEFPANTMLSFGRARQLGCEMVECDIRRSVDGALVLAHDPHVVDTAGKQWEIASTHSEVLHDLNLGAGEGVPFLSELVVWAAKAPCAIMADMKCEGDGAEELVASALAPLPPAIKLVPGAGAESRARFRAADPLLPLSLSLGAEEGEELLLNFELIGLLDRIDTEAVTWQYPLLNERTISALKSRGLTVYAWTVDDMTIATRLVEMGVDGVISNRSDLLVNVVVEEKVEEEDEPLPAFLR